MTPSPRAARELSGSEDLASRYSHLEDATLDRLEEELPTLKADRLHATAREFAVAKGINTDKARLHRGEATQITETRDLSDILGEIGQRHPGLFRPAGAVDSTATEEPEPEEPPELPPAA